MTIGCSANLHWISWTERNGSGKESRTTLIQSEQFQWQISSFKKDHFVVSGGEVDPELLLAWFFIS